MKNQNNYKALTEMAARIKFEVPVLDYFFELENKGALKYEGKIGKEHFFGTNDQKTGSIAIKESSNLWFDHADGKGGDIIRAVQHFENKSFREAIEYLAGKRGGEISPISRQVAPKIDENKNIIKVLKVLDTIEHPALVSYVQSRFLNLEDLKDIAKEIHYQKTIYEEGNKLDIKKYFAIGFATDEGGYAIRNKFQKGKIIGGSISTFLIGNKPTSIKIFEGGFDLAAFRHIYPRENFKAKVLNGSANLTESLLIKIKQEKEREGLGVDLYLDNDTTGNKKTLVAKEIIPDSVDQRELYEGYNDLNAFLISKNETLRVKR